MLPVSRTILPGVLALALAALPAAPARADLSSFEKFAIFAGGVTILGLALNSQSRAHAAPPARHYHHVAPPPRHHGPIRVMPAHCIRQGQAGHRAVHVLPQVCLAQAGVHVTSLPHQCRVHIHGLGPGYTARCLRAAGFVIA